MKAMGSELDNLRLRLIVLAQAGEAKRRTRNAAWSAAAALGRLSLAMNADALCRRFACDDQFSVSDHDAANALEAKAGRD